MTAAQLYAACHTCSFNRHHLILDARLDIGDPWELVQGACDVLGTTVACHGHREECLFQVSSVKSSAVSCLAVPRKKRKVP